MPVLEGGRNQDRATEIIAAKRNSESQLLIPAPELLNQAVLNYST